MEKTHSPWNVNTLGIVPMIYKKELILVKGGIRGGLFQSIHGIPYKYEDFPWKDSNIDKIDKEKFLKLAEKNEEINHFCTEDLMTKLKNLK